MTRRQTRDDVGVEGDGHGFDVCCLCAKIASLLPLFLPKCTGNMLLLPGRRKIAQANESCLHDSKDTMKDTFAGFSNFTMRNGQQSNLQVAHNTSIQDFTKSLSRKNAEDLEPNCGKGDAVCSPRFR
jgi:hypothetical protein